MNIYAPNSRQIPWPKSILLKLESFRDGVTVVGGDLNLVLNPLIDSSSHKSVQSQRGIRSLLRALAKAHLIDIWCTMHPDSRDYTFYSSLHRSYQRLDYLFVSKEHLQLCSRAEMGSIILSDHAPIYLHMKSPLNHKPTSHWRFNDLINSLAHQTLNLS